MACAVFVLGHLAFATFFAVLATALGRRLAALAGPAARTERWGLPLALGLGAIGSAMSLLAAAGRLTAPWLIVLLAAAAGAAAGEAGPAAGAGKSKKAGAKGRKAGGAAARVDGAAGWRAYRAVTLPLLRPALLVAAVLNLIYVFNSFPIVWTLNDRNPGMAHDTMITYMYKIAFKSALRDVGLAAALGVVNVVLILLAVLAYLRVSEWREEPV